jgi:hypothetical protein
VLRAGIASLGRAWESFRFLGLELGDNLTADAKRRAVGKSSAGAHIGGD